MKTLLKTAVLFVALFIAVPAVLAKEPIDFYLKLNNQTGAWYALYDTGAVAKFGDEVIPELEKYEKLRLFYSESRQAWCVIATKLEGHFSDTVQPSGDDLLEKTSARQPYRIAIARLAEVSTAAEKVFRFDGKTYKTELLAIKLTWHEFGGCAQQVAEEFAKAGFGRLSSKIAEELSI